MIRLCRPWSAWTAILFIVAVSLLTPAVSVAQGSSANQSIDSIVALVDDHQTETVVETAREAGATGDTVITSARGEGLKPTRTFLGLDLSAQRDMVLLLVEEHLSRTILERICAACSFDGTSGTGIAFQLDIEDAVGLGSQIDTISREIEDKI